MNIKDTTVVVDLGALTLCVVTLMLTWHYIKSKNRKPKGKND